MLKFQSAVKMDTPIAYRIQVQGQLSPRSVERLGSITDTSIDQSASAVVTTLVGQMADQAELLGVLNTLYDWRYPLLFVELLSNPESESD